MLKKGLKVRVTYGLYKIQRNKNKKSVLLELGGCVNQVNMAHELLSAAIPFQAQIIQDFLNVFAFGNSFFILFP